MKKNLPLLICLLLIENMFGQILLRNENWPNPAWTVSGTYTPASLVSNPTTVDSNFKFDSALVSPSGVNTLIQLSSPTFDLKPAFDGNEKILKIGFNIAFTTYAMDKLYIEYWNADTSSWVVFANGSAEIQSVGSYSACTMVPGQSEASVYLDFSGFTTNQLQNFKYRLVVNGTSSEIAGVCLNSMVANSSSCNAPSNLTVFGVTSNQASFNWAYSGIGTIYWNIEYGPIGFALGTGIKQQINSTFNPPYTINGLNPNTVYSFYIEQDCSGGDGVIFSGWTGPKIFKTATLGLEEVKLEGLKLYPNPTKGLLVIEAANTINEVKVYNLLGQELLTQKGKAPRLNLDLTTFDAGFYFLKIDTEKGTGVYKVVRN